MGRRSIAGSSDTGEDRDIRAALAKVAASVAAADAEAAAKSRRSLFRKRNKKVCKTKQTL